EVGGEQRGMDLAAALDQDAEQVAPAELVQQRCEVDSAFGVRGQLQDLRQPDVSAPGGGDQSVRTDDSGRVPDAEPAVEHDRERLAHVPAVLESGRELGVVGDHGVDADEDRVVLVPQAVGMQPGLLAGDPARLARAGGDLAVEADGELRGHEGTAGGAVLDVELVQTPRAVLVEANGGVDAGLLERSDAGSVDAWVGVGHRDDGAADAGLDQCTGAALGPVSVGAGLEVHIDAAAPGAVARLLERLLLGMWLSLGSVVALAGEVALAVQHHRADHRVGAGPVVGTARQLEGARRPVKVGGALQGMYLSCHCNNRIRSTRFSKMRTCAGPLCSLALTCRCALRAPGAFSDLKSEL